MHSALCSCKCNIIIKIDVLDILADFVSGRWCRRPYLRLAADQTLYLSMLDNMVDECT